MPLLVDDLESPTCRIEKWTTMLVGKKLGDGNGEHEFPKSDLPANRRIITPNSAVTLDFDPERLNIYLDESGVVTHINYC